MASIRLQNFIVFFLVISSALLNAQTIEYTLPNESDQHEGTWLQWPHNYLYGPFYRDDLEDTWLQMTEALIPGEKVHIIVYNQTELNYLTNLLAANGIPTTNIDFYIHPTNDCWIRDNGPMFVFDENNELVILDWGFNGWGAEYPYNLCNLIPNAVASDIGLSSIDLSAMVLEGGAVDVDGNGSMMATMSSIINDDRNPGLSQSDIENYMTTYMGITNFIWLQGVAGLDITDMHIDGFAMFHDDNTIVTMNSTNLTYWDVPAADITTLYNATNAQGQPFDYVYLPLTVNNVVTTWGENIGYKGSYVNYAVSNTVVLVPTYNDPNDNVAINIIQSLYPTRTAVGIDCRNLYYGGGMVHCVTKQQPFSENFTVACNASCATGSPHHLSITTDCWGEESSWNITNSSGTIIYSQAVGTLADLHTYTWDLCLTAGCYNFNIYDDYGDGMSGGQWNFCGFDGDYTITDDLGNVLVNMSVADFGFSETHNFCATTIVEGCTNPAACNYNPAAVCNDGSCTYPGCTDNSANNYDASAMCDDGSCTYDFCVGDFDFNGFINTGDLLLFMANFGCVSACNVYDLNIDGAVNTSDLLLFMALFGTFCP